MPSKQASFKSVHFSSLKPNMYFSKAYFVLVTELKIMIVLLLKLPQKVG